MVVLFLTVAYVGNMLFLAINMVLYWKMNNMNKGSKWSKYKNKATGDIVEARPNTKFPEYQLLRWDEGVFGGVKTCTSMLVTEFKLES